MSERAQRGWAWKHKDGEVVLTEVSEAETDMEPNGGFVVPVLVVPDDGRYAVVEMKDLEPVLDECFDHVCREWDSGKSIGEEGIRMNWWASVIDRIQRIRAGITEGRLARASTPTSERDNP